MVTLDDAGAVVRPAMLWNDVKSAPQAAELVAEFGGPAEWAARTGSVPTMSFTVTKLRWLAEREPQNAARVHRVVLPHDWLTWRLAGGGPGEPPRGGAGGGAGGACGRAAGQPHTRPGGGLGHRLLLPRRGRVAAGVRRAGARPAGRAAAGGLAVRDRRADLVGR